MEREGEMKGEREGEKKGERERGERERRRVTRRLGDDKMQ